MSIFTHMPYELFQRDTSPKKLKSFFFPGNRFKLFCFWCWIISYNQSEGFKHIIFIIMLKIKKKGLYLTVECRAAPSLFSVEHKKWWKFDKHYLLLHLSPRMGLNLVLETLIINDIAIGDLCQANIMPIWSKSGIFKHAHDVHLTIFF